MAQTMHTFAIRSQVSTQPAAIRRPREVTHFSYDSSHTYCQNDSSLKYFYPPLIPADLSSGFESFRQLDDSGDEHLDGLIRCITHLERQTGKRLDVNIITWRGMMTKILTAPFSYLDSWEMNATLFDCTIFIEENHQYKMQKRDEQYSSVPGRGAMSQDLMSYWGYKFEALSTLDKHWVETSREEIEQRGNVPVSNHAQYCSVVRTGFGSTKVALGGEVDCLMRPRPDKPSDPVDWVELKTTAELVNEKEQSKFERKLLKFWAQSFLLGVPRIVVGFRDQQGWLQRIQELQTQHIPEMVAKGTRLWDGQQCIDFTSGFLEFLRSTITDQGVWKIRKREKSPVIEVFKAEEAGTGDILSKEFMEWRMYELPKLVQEIQTAQSRQSGAEVEQQSNGNVLSFANPP